MSERGFDSDGFFAYRQRNKKKFCRKPPKFQIPLQWEDTRGLFQLVLREGKKFFGSLSKRTAHLQRGVEVRKFQKSWIAPGFDLQWVVGAENFLKKFSFFRPNALHVSVSKCKRANTTLKGGTSRSRKTFSHGRQSSVRPLPRQKPNGSTLISSSHRSRSMLKSRKWMRKSSVPWWSVSVCSCRKRYRVPERKSRPSLSIGTSLVQSNCPKNRKNRHSRISPNYADIFPRYKIP